MQIGRSSGLLNFYQPSHPHLWTVVSQNKSFLFELTATGTAPDLNRIPFSSQFVKKQMYENQMRCKCMKKDQ